MFSKYSSLDRLVVRLLGRACKEQELIECQNKNWNGKNSYSNGNGNIGYV